MCSQNNLSKHCLCHDTGEISHTFLSYMRVNFHREVSLTLFYFFFDFPVEYLDLSCHFCYNLLWVIVPKTEQSLKRTVVKIEHFTAVFLYPKERKKVAEMANRNRTNPVQFYLSDDEQYILNTKFKASGMKSMSAFLRKLILYGYVYDVDYSYLRNYNTELGRISSNLNQIAKRVNSTGNIYQEDINEVKELMNEVWHTQKSMLSKQPLIKP